jgi:hypothetical protein
MSVTGTHEVSPAAEQLLRWHAPLAAAGLGLASVAVMAAATATSDHDFWLFAVWVVLTLAAIVTGLAVLLRVPRSPGRMGTRRLASFGVVIAVLCATLGLAVYSQTRIHDCPTTGICAPADPGKGQRPQQPTFWLRP